MSALRIFIVIPILESLHDLLVEEHVDLIYPKGVGYHQEGWDQERDVKQTSQETEIVDECEELPVGLDYLICHVQVPVSQDLGIRLGACDRRVCVVSPVVHAIVIVSLLLGEVKGSQFQEGLVGPPVLIKVLHPIIFILQNGSGKTHVHVRDDTWPLRCELNILSGVDDQSILLL